MPGPRHVLTPMLVVAALLSLSVGVAEGAAGDLNNDGYDDLVIGVPSEDVGQVDDAGAVNILIGSETGIVKRKDRLFTQADLGGTVEGIDRFGNAIAYGDFDNDGYDDVAIGAPTEDYRGKADAGVVHIVYGSANGANRRDTQLLSQAGAMAGANESGDFFGAVLAAGDINNDGYDDLAIGTPGENVSGRVAAGAVILAFGSRTGITTKRSKFLTQKGAIPGAAEAFDGFGVALAIADFNGDNFDDLAVGTPGEGLTGAEDAGTVTVLYGRKSGINRRGSLFTRSATVGGASVEGDAFGNSLTAGDFNGDGIADLAAGAPGQESAGIENAGGIVIFSGAAAGLTAAATTAINQDGAVPGDSETGDEFGSVLAAGNFDGVIGDELVVGIPNKTVNGLVGAGQVVVIPGSANGLNEAASSAFSQDLLAKATIEADDRLGASLRVGNFNGDAYDDLAVASPREDVRAKVDSGVVHVILGTANGLDPATAKRYHQGVKGIAGKAEARDRFGTGL